MSPHQINPTFLLLIVFLLILSIQFISSSPSSSSSLLSFEIHQSDPKGKEITSSSPRFIRKSSLIHQEISSEQWIANDETNLMEEIDWTLSDHYFSHCWNTTRLMRDDLYYDRMFTMGEEIPSSFGCNSIKLPTVYEYYPINRKSIYNSELRNIGVEDEALCSRVADWESKLNVSCQALLCEMDGKSAGFSSLNEMIRSRTDSRTSIEDWVNYCQYCKVDNLRKYKEEKKCNPRDETASLLIGKFPNSAFFCGFHQFGIPFIINTSRIVDLSVPLEHTDFSFICYCRESQAFHFKCPDVTTEFELKTEYLAFLFTVLNTVSIVTTLLLPKGFFMIKDRKINWNMLTTLFMLSAQCAFAGFHLYKIVSREEYSKSIVFFECGFGLANFAVISWLIEFHRFIHYVRTRTTYKKLLIILRLVIFISLSLVILLPSLLVANLVQLKKKKITFIFLQFYFGSFELITLISLIVGSIVIYRAMKQISDIDIWKTTFLKFTLLAAFLLLLITICNFVVGGLYFIRSDVDLFWWNLKFFANQVLFIAMTWIEFDKLEFNQLYGCHKLAKKEKSDLEVDLNTDYVRGTRVKC